MIHVCPRLVDYGAAALRRGTAAGVPLVAAGACVGIIIGVVTLTGAGIRLPSLIVPLAQQHLLGALVVLMISSLVRSMESASSVPGWHGRRRLLGRFSGGFGGDVAQARILTNPATRFRYDVARRGWMLCQDAPMANPL